MIGFVLGWIYGHLFEWAVHKYLLHSRHSKKRDGIFSFHFREHHAKSRRNGFVDTSYAGLPIRSDAAGKEALSLLFVLILHAPILYLSKCLIIIHEIK